jgi:metal-sulfur cluster biosynthetic enzyme
MTRDLESAVESTLRKVQNPSLGADVYEAGLVHGFAVDGGDVSVALATTAVDPTMARGVADAVVSAVGGVDEWSCARKPCPAERRLRHSSPTGRLSGLYLTNRTGENWSNVRLGPCHTTLASPRHHSSRTASANAGAPFW